jgi:hypothetical protein
MVLMEKAFYKSATIQGLGAYLLVKFAVSQGWIPDGMTTDAIELISSLWGIYGVRRAIGSSEKKN